MNYRKLLLPFLLGMFAVAVNAAKLTLPFEKTVVIKGNDLSADFAVKELNDIVNRATGSTFRIGKEKDGAVRIHVGRTPAVEKYWVKSCWMVSGMKNLW